MLAVTARWGSTFALFLRVAPVQLFLEGYGNPGIAGDREPVVLRPSNSACTERLLTVMIFNVS